MASRISNPRSNKSPYIYIVSACLAGINCTYDKKNKLNERVRRLCEDGIAIPVCPEVLGGSSVPRKACEIESGDGDSVLTGKARVLAADGKDISGIMIRGARATLKIIRKYGIRNAIMKSKSPSCGSGAIYDGSFSSTLVKGDGVTVALLKRNGVSVYDEKSQGLWPVKSTTRK